MSSLTLIVTDAGRAALVNAANNGTNTVLIAAVGVTDQAFVAAANTAVLPGELKRLTTFAGSAVADDTIHVSIRDDSADTYSLRGFALYLDDGTLFASYGQVDAIGEKSAQSMLLVALDVIFADIAAANLTFGDTNFLLASATTEQQGIVELATDAEATTGTDAERAVVPKGLKAALDARFGAGAPSAFIKSLLTAATALACRTALGIKLAATFDPGTGNGLDADLLDGQHGAYYLAWGNLTGVPAVFPPSAHTHAWADISNPPAQATRWADWTEVTNKPAAYPPLPHSQDWSTILNIPATATRWPAWGEVSGKPAFGSASLTNVEAYATAAQGVKADSATQPDTFVSFTQTALRASDTRGAVLAPPGSLAYGTVGALNGYGSYFCANLYYNGAWHQPDPSLYGVFVSAQWTDGSVNIGGCSPGGATATRISFKLDGTVTAVGFTTAASSRTVKHDIAPCRYGLKEFLQIPWVEYRYDKSITDDDRLRFGSLVEGDGKDPGVEDFAPELVIRREGQVPTFEYDQFIPVLGMALQQYITINDARLEAAKARAALADARLARLTVDLADALARIRVLERR